MLFGVLFPICQKISLEILHTVKNYNYGSQYVFLGPMTGQDSMFNLIISSIAATLAYFFTNLFVKLGPNKS